MQWISVKDRLPERCSGDDLYSVNVLITDGSNIAVGYHKFEYDGNGDTEGDSLWNDYGDLLVGADSSGWPNVTHWMPLPKSPESK